MSLYPDVAAKLHRILEQAEQATAHEAASAARQGFDMAFSLAASRTLLDLNRQWKDIVLHEVPLEDNGAFMDGMQPEWQALQKLVRAAHPAAVREKRAREDAAARAGHAEAVQREGKRLWGQADKPALTLVVDNDR